MALIGLATVAIRRQPALPVAILFILGIGTHRLIPCWPIAWLSALTLLLAGGIMLRRRPASCSALIALGIFASGICAAQLARFNFAQNDVGAFAGDEGRLEWVEGRIEETPRLIESVSEGRPLPDKQTLLLDVRSVRTWKGWESAKGQMPVTLSPPAPALAAGQTVQLFGRIERPRPAMNPGGFDSAIQYRRDRVLVSFYVSRSYDVQILSQPARLAAPLVGLRDGARRLLDRGFEPGRGADRSLLRALVFGDREPALRAVSDDFIRSGTTHVLAANGARIAMLAGIAYLLCRLLRLPPRVMLAAVTAIIIAFGFLTMPLAQAIRPIIVCVALGFGLLGKRQANSIQLLALAALTVLIVNPLDLYGAGFQLSFVIVLGLILLTPPLTTFLQDKLRNRDREVADSFLPQTWRRRAKLNLKRWSVAILVTGFVAWLLVIPLAAYHFEQFNPWTVPFGAVLSPLAATALMAGFLKIGLTAVCPPLAATWASAAWVPATALRHAVHELGHVPGADLPIARPAVWSILLYYTFLILPLIKWPRRSVRWCARCAPVGACVMVIVLPVCGGFAPLRSDSTSVRITLLSLGAGQCAVVEPSGSAAILIDAGSSTLTDPLRTCVEPFLRHEQCLSIDSIWLSHGDYDHISAVRDIMPEYDVREVVTSPHFRRHAHESKPCAALLAMLDRTHHSPHQVVSGTHVRIGNNTELEVLWPPADCAFNSNNAGMVLKLTCAGRSILFPADIQEPAERELLKHPENLRADILVAPHHGSSELTTPQFIAAVDPQIIVASNDARLTMKQRIFDSETGGRPLYRTSKYGAIAVEFLRDGTVRVTPYLSGQTLTLPPNWIPP